MNGKHWLHSQPCVLPVPCVATLAGLLVEHTLLHASGLFAACTQGANPATKSEATNHASTRRAVTRCWRSCCKVGMGKL